MNTIDSSSLKSIVEKIASFLSERSQKYELEEDNYWLVGSDRWYDFSSCPKADEVGSLKDDWHFLKQIAHDNRPVTVVDLDKLAAVLRAISEQTASTR